MKYEQWKKCVVLLDQNWRKCQEAKKLSSLTHHAPAMATSTTITAMHPMFHCQPAPLVTTPAQPSPTIQQGQGQTFGGLGQLMDLGATRTPSEKKCFCCGSGEHLVRNCPQLWAPRTLARSMEVERLFSENKELKKELADLHALKEQKDF